MADKKDQHKEETKERKEVEELKQRNEELENKYKRVLADYANLLKRTEEEREKFIKFANEILITKSLDVLDDLEQSQKHISDEGLNKVVTKYQKLLKDEGVEEIEAEGKDFDPELHEAIERVEGEKDKVIKVHRKGYKYHSKPLRAALVAVGSGK